MALNLSSGQICVLITAIATLLIRLGSIIYRWIDETASKARYTVCTYPQHPIPMSKIEVLEALQHLTPEETLEVIETASRILRNNISPLPKLSLVQAADRMKAFYEPGHEHVQWVDEDPEEFQEYKDYA
jgi:hypothetical protein